MATDSKQVKITFVAQDNTSQAISKIDQIVDKFGKTVNKATKANNDLKNALKGVDNSADKASKAFDELNAEAQKYATNLVKSVNQQKIYIKNLIAIRDATEITSKEHTRMSAEVQKLTNSLTQFQRGGTKLTKVNGDMQSSTGLASGAVIEFGRGVSDAGFGITGVANNLQQFAAMFISLRQETNGTTGALKAMATQFMGPLGILVAFQGAIALIEFLNRKYDLFGQKVDEATKELKEQKQELVSNTTALRGYAMVLDNANSSEEARKVAVEEITKVLPNLTEEELNSKDALELTNIAIEEYIRNQSIRLEIDALLDENQEKFSDNREIRRIKELEGQEKLDAQLEFLEEKGINRVQQGVIAQRKLAEERDVSSRRAERILMQLPTSDRVTLAFDSFTSEVESEYKKTIAKIAELQGQLTDGGEGDDDGVKKPEVSLANAIIPFDRELAQGQLDAMAEVFDIEIGMVEKKEIKLRRINQTSAAEEAKLAKSRAFVQEKTRQDRLATLDALASATHAASTLFAEGTAENKAFGIASATIDTYIGANQVWKDETLPTIAKIPAVASIILSGLANVKKIASVEIPNKGASGGSTASPSIQAPDFNIVGSSDQSQLAQTISQAEQQPVQAFVVAEDVTSAQQLDRNIIQGASLG